MKKYVYLVVLLTNMFAGCSKDENTNREPYIEIDNSELLLTNQSGNTRLKVKWAYVEWEIETETSGFISNFSFLKGGSRSHTGVTEVTFSYSENTTGEERDQDIILKDVTTGKQMKLVARQLPKPPIEITVNPAIQYQNITGFGGMLNPALWLGSNQLTEEEIQQLYSSSGLGYNMIRMMIYPDPANWQRDVAVALKAQSLGVRILASPWTPPAALKSNNNQVGGHLLPENYQAYVDHLNAFVDYMASRGITIEAVSIQNEPDILVSYDGCEWTREELRIFMRDYAGQIKARVIAAESFNFKQDYTDQILNDAVAEKNLDIVGGHLYGGGLKDYPLARNKGKEIWMTEHLMNEVNNGMGWEQAMIFAKEVHDCMAANFNAYIWWYLKRHYSMLGDGEHGAVVGQTLKRGYILSHYAKYATGRKRVQVSSITGNSNVLITAYESEHDITLVLINQGQETVPSLKINLSTVINSATAIETSDTDNMANHTITVSADKKSTITSVPAQSVVSIRLTK